ncbi:hypothetical protein JD844_032532 [Phrynosoma platyrhinos]|uniref:Dystrophin n=1 Tax=Phrynosoma platyrhinos TaxID=52577 RepID=A0ABQ7T590_PHRPL|nr:hypothetical protein JD844_032532 [Phrynosoma platyrhinos]
MCRQEKDLQDGIGRQQAVVRTLNLAGEEVIEQSSTADASVLKEKLGSLNFRWKEVCRQLTEKKKRIEEEQNLLADLQNNFNKLILWLDEGSETVRIPLEPGNEYQLKDTLEKVKLRVEELPAHKGILKRLNEAGGKALGSASLSPEVKHKLDTKLKEANHRWIKVSKDLPEKQKEIEHVLNNLNQFEQQLGQLQLWLSPIKEQLELYNRVGQPGAFDIKVIAIKDMEGIGQDEIQRKIDVGHPGNGVCEFTVNTHLGVRWAHMTSTYFCELKKLTD